MHGKETLHCWGESVVVAVGLMKKGIKLKNRNTGVMNDMNAVILKKLTGLILIILISSTAFGQQPECFVVHTDKSFYISGETIWFKVYLLNDSSEAKSRVLHVDLVTHQNKTVARQKLLIEHRTSNGSITLPMDSEEGFYRFRAYTLYNLNFKPTHIYEKIIPVFQLDNKDIIQSNPIKVNKSRFSVTTVVSIVSDKEIYKPRDSLTVSFQINGSKDIGDGNFSVSVVPLEIASTEFPSDDHSECVDVGYDGDQLIPPERSLFVEGKLLDSETKLNVTSGLISIYMDKTSQLIKASSKDGNIKVPVPDYWGPGIFQILNLDPYQPLVYEFLPVSGSKFSFPYYNSDLPPRTQIVTKYMDQLKKRRKITELFNLYKSRDIKYSAVSVMKPDIVYRTKDYKQIYSFEEFINEAIGNVKVRIINEEKTVRLFNKEMGRLFMDHPWYIVDGYLTFDEEEVLNIQYEDLLEVRLFTKTSTIMEYFERFMWRNGVMEIITRDVKYSRKLRSNPNVVELEGFSINQNFNTTFTLSENKRTPDLRGVMYWSPNVLTNEKGQAQVTIPLSDDTGKFAIVVMGSTSIHDLVTGYTTFEIK